MTKAGIGSDGEVMSVGRPYDSKSTDPWARLVIHHNPAPDALRAMIAASVDGTYYRSTNTVGGGFDVSIAPPGSAAPMHANGALPGMRAYLLDRFYRELEHLPSTHPEIADLFGRFYLATGRMDTMGILRWHQQAARQDKA